MQATMPFFSMALPWCKVVIPNLFSFFCLFCNCLCNGHLIRYSEINQTTNFVSDFFFSIFYVLALLMKRKCTAFFRKRAVAVAKLNGGRMARTRGLHVRTARSYSILSTAPMLFQMNVVIPTILSNSQENCTTSSMGIFVIPI